MQIRDRVLGDGILHPPAVSWRLFIDRQGSMWLCEKDADENKDPKDQGCWNCADVAFNCAARNA